ncbi:MAG: DUF167 domain-containing protein [Methanotrichaceae archaeon]|nr:DUF167 domain-containing protein [Methanotrichaceae archaeon]
MDEAIRSALDRHPKGVTLRFEVVPGTSRTVVPSGVNRWRHSLEARLTAEPSRGKANRQLIEELALRLDVPPGRVEVLSGHKSSRKLLLVHGLEIDEALDRLALGGQK